MKLVLVRRPGGLAKILFVQLPRCKGGLRGVSRLGVKWNAYENGKAWRGLNLPKLSCPLPLFVGFHEQLYCSCKEIREADNMTTLIYVYFGPI